LAATGANLAQASQRAGIRMNIPSIPDFHAGALAGVVVGAVLATLSGILGNHYETFARRHEQERSAAMLFGEVLSTVRVLLEAAEGSVNTGEPFGPVTRRLLGVARREMAIYERNRESLVALQDAKLRSEVHNVALRLCTALDALTDSFVVVDPLLLSEADIEGSRRWAFGFLMENGQRIPELTRRLGRLAKHNFEDYAEAVRVRQPEAPAVEA
jgi:hypothetical protein